VIDNLREKFITTEDEYTPIPFWFWNSNLEEKEIRRQIHDFKAKGVMGFVIHPRIGVPKEIEYLSDRFMELVKFAVEEAADLGMKVVLYDEAMYPSGSAHGKVVKDNPEYASRGFKVVEYALNGVKAITYELEAGEKVVSALFVEKLAENEISKDNIKKLSFEVENSEVTVKVEASSKENEYVLLFIETFSKGTIRGIHFGEDDGEKDAPPAGDLLNKKAMEKFIALTHDRYYEVLNKYFGNTIIAMFTDEPGILGRAGKRGLKPWTEGFLEWYLECGNKVEDLAVLWYEAGEETENIRKNYRKAVNKKLEETYYKPISQWCEKHNIALTGHPEKSDEIGFLKYFHIPGQDVVWRWIAPENNKGIIGEHSTMGKCSSDAARHMGRKRNSNECFGCCGPDGVHWAFSAADMKWYFDWLFIRGVNLVYPHAFFYSIDGPGRFGERPPDVGPNNIWWENYGQFSKYIKRMCSVMSDSYNTTPIAVLCEEDFLPWHIVKPLYENQIEFNYLEDNLIIKGCNIEKGEITIEKQSYKLLIIEDPAMLSEELSLKLQGFINAGGKVVICNPSNKKYALKGSIELTSFEQIVEVVDKLSMRELKLLSENSNLRVSHIVKNGVHFYCLVNEGEGSIESDICLNTIGYVEKWDPWTGNMTMAEVKEVTPEGVVVNIKLDFRSSVLLCVDEKISPMMYTQPKYTTVKQYEIENKSLWKVYKAEEEVTEPQLMTSITTWKGFGNYSGTMSYVTNITIEELKAYEKLVVDFGEVHEICELFVNEKFVGNAMWAPYSFDITEYAMKGENKIELKVTNTLANKIEKKSIKSGLMGPVKVIHSKRL
jgi:hypothetical protein